MLTAKHCVLDPGSTSAEASLFGVRFDSRHFGIRRIVVLGGEYDGVATVGPSDLALLQTAQPIPVDAPDIEIADLSADAETDATLFAATGAGVVETRLRRVATDLIFTAGVTCGGDSGGGLFDAGGRLVGVASWRTDRCGAGSSVYVRLAPHAGWLAHQTAGIDE